MKLRLSFKLIGLFLLMGLGPLLIITVLVDFHAGEALRRVSFDKLDVARSMQEHQIEDYFQERFNEVSALSYNETIVNSMIDLQTVFHEAMKEKKKIDPLLLISILDPKVVAWFKKRIEFNGYHDLLLIDEDGHVIFSVAQESDLGADLMHGELQESALSLLFTKAKNGVAIQDFMPYAPSNGEYSAFLGAPILKDGVFLGVVALQLPTAPVDDVMRIRAGMSKSEETYLVGRLNGLSSYRSNRAVKEGKIGQKKIGELIEKALNGETGHTIKLGSTGDLELVSYAPIDVPGLNWAIFGTIGVDEAYAEIYLLDRALLVVGLVLAVIVIVIGWYFARSITVPLINVVNTMNRSVSQIGATINQQERVATQQAASVNETNTTMEELGVSAKQSAEQAETASNGSKAALELTQLGLERVEVTQQSMELAKEKVDIIAQQILRLSEQTSQIRDITGLVFDFANETKMLAMNSAVEAVRAGEHGKGFSVLAVETRKLADESKRSAVRINGLVGEIQKATNSTVMSTEEGSKTMAEGIANTVRTTQAFQLISDAVETAFEGSQQISMNIRQQAIAIRQVVEAMQSINTGAKESAMGVNQVKIGVRTLTEAAKALKELV